MRPRRCSWIFCPPDWNYSGGNSETAVIFPVSQCVPATMEFYPSWSSEEGSVEVLRNAPPQQDIMDIAATSYGSLRELDKEFGWSTLGGERKAHKKVLSSTPLLECTSFKAAEEMEEHFNIAHKRSSSKKRDSNSSRMQPTEAEEHPTSLPVSVLATHQLSRYIPIPLMTSTPLLPLFPYQDPYQEKKEGEEETKRKDCSSLFKDSEEGENSESTLHKVVINSRLSENPLEARTSSKFCKKQSVCKSSATEGRKNNRSSKVMLVARRVKKIKKAVWGKKGGRRDGGKEEEGVRNVRRAEGEGRGQIGGEVTDETGARNEVEGLHTCRIGAGRERQGKITKEKAKSKTKIVKNGVGSDVKNSKINSQSKKKALVGGVSVQPRTGIAANTTKGRKVAVTLVRAAHSTRYCPPSVPLALPPDYDSVPVCPTLTQYYPPNSTVPTNCKFLPFPGMDQFPLDNLITSNHK